MVRHGTYNILLYSTLDILTIYHRDTAIASNLRTLNETYNINLLNNQTNTQNVNTIKSICVVAEISAV